LINVAGHSEPVALDTLDQQLAKEGAGNIRARNLRMPNYPFDCLGL